MARGIKDKVAILGMGCSKFGERWDSGAEELMLESYKECLADAGIDAKQLNAAWFSTAIDEVHVGKSGIPLSTTRRLPNIPGTDGIQPTLSVGWAVHRSDAEFPLTLSEADARMYEMKLARKRERGEQDPHRELFGGVGKRFGPAGP